MVKNDNLWLKFNQSTQCVVQLMVILVKAWLNWLIFNHGGPYRGSVTIFNHWLSIQNGCQTCSFCDASRTKQETQSVSGNWAPCKLAWNRSFWGGLHFQWNWISITIYIVQNSALHLRALPLHLRGKILHLRA
jgi:hypothetical protein